MKQPRFIFFSCPRTGSTIISQLFYLYAAKKFGYTENLGEYFNTQNGNDHYLDNGTHISKINSSPTKCIVVEWNRTELLRRVQMLKKYRQHYYGLKACGSQLQPWLIHFLNRAGYQFILIERRDVLDHLLSFCIAQDTKIFNSTQLTKSYSSLEIEIKIRDFEMIPKMFNQSYYSQREKIKKIYRTLYYEDFSALDNKLEVLSLLGFDDWSTYLQPDMKEVKEILHQNHKLLSKEEKLRLVCNRAEVLRFYADRRAEIERASYQRPTVWVKLLEKNKYGASFLDFANNVHRFRHDRSGLLVGSGLSLFAFFYWVGLFPFFKTWWFIQYQYKLGRLRKLFVRTEPSKL